MSPTTPAFRRATRASLSILSLAAPLLGLACLLLACGARSEASGPALPEGTAARPAAPSYEPFVRPGGGKYRIAVIQSGEYKDYYIYLQALLDGFAALDWMEEVDLLGREGLEMGDRLARIAESAPSAYIEFPPELHYNLDWDDARAASREFRALLARKDVDAYFTLGTFASKTLADQPGFLVPVLGESMSSPVESEVIASVEDSGKDFLTVRYDPEQFSAQVRIFQDVVKFRRLGILHHPSEDGEIEAGLPDARRVAEEKGFEILTYTKGIQRLGEIPEKEIPAARKALLVGIEELAPKVDAFYFGLTEGLDDENLPAVLALLQKHKKPSFSMEGEYHVRKGILLGTSEGDLVAAGLFNARKFVDIFRGASPRSLPQLYKVSPNIVVNLLEAERIGFDVPVEIVASADKVYYALPGEKAAP